MARVEHTERVSVANVIRFVWSYWRGLPVRFALVVAGVLIAIALEIQVPDRAARMMNAIERFGTGQADLDPAWAALGALV